MRCLEVKEVLLLNLEAVFKNSLTGIFSSVYSMHEFYGEGACVLSLVTMAFKGHASARTSF